jgi:uncharacterized SAM-binding protein YcdF (DUF218 family)
MRTDAAARRHPLRRLASAAWTVLALIGLLFVVVSSTPLVIWWGGVLGGDWSTPRGEIMIVLGGSDIGPGVLGTNSYWRSVYATRFYQEGGIREIVISGSSVAPAMKDYLVSHGVPGGIIRTEDASHSTRENAVNTARLLAGVPGRKLLVTSDYHMYRAARTFRKAGLDILQRPFPDVRKRGSTWMGRWPAFLDLVVESAKIGYYSARGWI